MADIFLYNTASRKIEKFEPVHDNKVGIYSCGMTVYYYAHVGHIRTYINSDILRRTLEYFGYEVTHVMNVTDVGHLTSDADEGEDKLEMGAKREGKNPWELARYYEKHFFETIKQVNILVPNIICRATEHIDDQIEMIKTLESKGYTYKTNVGIIYDTSKFADYAKFAKLNLDGQVAGARVKVDPERKNPSDFALWVTNQPTHIMQWESPWGKGFPGWHIECSAMSIKYLGATLDIHTGGIDHIPVHHTNEIAQSEAATGQKFVKYWFHSDFLNIENEKMSKSLNNLYTIEDIKKCGFHPLALRYLFLTSSYRTSMNFTWSALEAAQKNLEKIWHKAAEYSDKKTVALENNPLIRDFENKIANNLNTGGVIALLLAVVEEPMTPENYSLMLEFDKILGLNIENAESRLKEIDEILAESNPNEKLAMDLLKKRDQFRRNKMFKEADECRMEIEKLNFRVEDTPMGSKLKPILNKI